MKQYTITKAYQALVRFSRLNLPMSTAYAVYMLMNTIEPAYRCGAKLEQDILLSLNIETHGDRMAFPDKDAAEKYLEKMRELNDMDVDIEVKPIDVSCDALGDQKMMPADIRSLEGFIAFTPSV